MMYDVLTRMGPPFYNETHLDTCVISKPPFMPYVFFRSISSLSGSFPDVCDVLYKMP